MNKIIVIIYFILFSFSVFALEVSISLDDAPRRNSGIFTGVERTEKLISIFKKHKIKVVFYANSIRLKHDDGLERMKQYDLNGHYIGNHTHSHFDLNKVSVKIFTNDIEVADNKLKNFSNYKKWFRFPFLHNGENEAKKNIVEEYLVESGYQNGYVTVDNSDWLMADILDKHVKRGGKFKLDKLCSVYSKMLIDSINFFDSSASKYLGRSPKHSLLLHENDLAVLCISTLVNEIRHLGWNIISPEILFTDPIYAQRPQTLFSNNGVLAAIIHEKTGTKLFNPWDRKKIENELKQTRALLD